MEIPVSLIISVVCFVWLSVSAIRRRNQTNTQHALPSNFVPPSAALLPVVSRKHTLVKVWDNQGTDIAYEQRGWWYLCSCGQKRWTKNISATSRGTEAKAIETWRDHSNLYEDMADETATNELMTAVKAEREYIEKYRKLCYCKGANDDLILLEQSRPKSLDA